MKRQQPQATKSNDPDGNRPPMVPPPPVPVDVAYLRTLHEMNRACGVASFRLEPGGGFTVNYWQPAPAAVDERAAEDAREDNEETLEKRNHERTFAAAGGFRQVGGRVMTPAMRSRLP